MQAHPHKFLTCRKSGQNGTLAPRKFACLYTYASRGNKRLSSLQMPDLPGIKTSLAQMKLWMLNDKGLKLSVKPHLQTLGGYVKSQTQGMLSLQFW